MAYKSWISYPLERPYPYRWFTPVAAILALIVLAASTVINYASNGYNLVPVYSPNPNQTTTKGYFGDWMSLLEGNTKPSCQHANIPVGTMLYTNNSALQYTLTSVKSGTGASLPSLIYYHNPLQNCSVNSIELQFQSAPGRTATQFAVSRWGIEAQAHVSCQVPNQHGHGYTMFELLADYNLVPDTVFMYTGTYKFPGRHANSSASLYWGESLLSMYYYWTMTAMENATYPLTDPTYYQSWAPWISAMMRFTRSGTTDDIKSLDYNRVRFRAVMPTLSWNNFTSEDDPYWFESIYYPSNLVNPTVGEVIDKGVAPGNAFSNGDIMAKAFESTILTDLGQRSETPNILTDAKLLQHFTAGFSDIIEYAAANGGLLLNVTGGVETGTLIGPAIEDYNTLGSTTGPLGVHTSTFGLEYLCSVPQRKSIGNLLVSLTIADLVFLQTGWIVFTFAVQHFMRKRDSMTDYCEGCLERQQEDEKQSLIRTPTRYGGSRGSYASLGVDAQSISSNAPLWTPLGFPEDVKTPSRPPI